MKHFSRLFLCLMLLFGVTSCDLGPVDPIQADMEEYAKQHMGEFDPGTYEFSYVSYPEEHRYYVELETLKAGLEKQFAGKTDMLKPALEVIDRLEKEYGVVVACREYVLHYWGKTEHGTKIPLMVFAVYDEEGNRLWIGSSKNDIPTYPALNMLRDRGELEF